MKLRIAFCVAICAVTLASARAESPTRFSADRPVDCRHIKLELTVDVPGKSVEGRATIEVEALRDVTTVTLDAVEFAVSAVAVSHEGGAPTEASFTHDGEHLSVEFGEPLAKGQAASILVDYNLHDPRDGLHFFGPSEDEPDVPTVVWSQGQSISNRYWFPCFDHPGERQTSEMIVTTAKGMEVSSNGHLKSRTENAADGTVTFHWAQDKPHVSYLVSMIVGEFVIEKDEWRGKEITYWGHPQYKQDLRPSFRNTKRMLDFFSDKIGIEYPWDRYAQICCEGFGGGMENTSATTLGNRAIHDERSRLDSDSDGLIAHELAHQWWGDLLTCREWAHIWLNEGFASYFEALWDEHDLGDDEFRYNMYQKAARARRGGRDRPIVDRSYASPDTMFDSRAYPKGAWVLHMIRQRLGDDQFWEVLNKYGSRHAYGTVETVDLRKVIEEVSGRSFERFFYDWTDRPGHPEVTVKYQWMNDDKLAKVTVKQTQEADAFHFPLALEFRFENGGQPVRVAPDITEKEESFYYSLAAKPVMFRVDPEQAVLMDLKEQKGSDLWKYQLTGDPDPIGRIRAARHFADSESDADRRLLADALASEKFRGVQQEIAESLAESGGDIARDALIAGLKLGNHKVRRTCVSSLATFRDDPAVLAAIRPMVAEGDASYYVEAEAIETYSKLEADDAYDLLTAALNRDSRTEVIRNAVLSGLGRLRDERVVSVLSEWTRPGKPRFCRPTALRALGDVTKRIPLDDSTVQSIVDTLAAALDDTGSRVRGQAVNSLGAIQDPGRAFTALPALRAMAANDASSRVRRGAERAMQAVESGKPAQVQLADLREELKEALEQNESMADRIERLEKRLADVDEKNAKSAAVAATDSEPAGEAN